MCPVDLLIPSPASRFSAAGLKRGFQPQLFSFSLFRILPKLSPHSPSCTPRRRTEKNVSSWQEHLQALPLFTSRTGEGSKLFREEHDRRRTVLNLDVLALSDVSAVPAPAWVAHGTPLNPAACVRKREAKKSSTFSQQKQPS